MTRKVGIIQMIGEGGLITLPAKDQVIVANSLRKQLKFSDDYKQAKVDPSLANAIPKPEDFLPFPFRHISATIIGGGSWKATDFSNEKVVKKIPALLSYKPVYLNHNLDVSNVVGTNGLLTYTEAKKVGGVTIPAGVDGPIWIDGLLHTDLCRKLAGYPMPQIQSVSTTIVFEWEPSHEFSDSTGNPDEWEFERQIGKIVEGKMVRRVVLDVIAAYETSLVWNGADPFAKMLDSKGLPVNIDKPAIVGSEYFDKDPLVDFYKSKGLFFLSENVFPDANTLNLHRQELINYSKTENPIINPKKEKGMELTKFLATVLGVAEDQVTEDLLKQYTFTKTADFTGIKANADALQATKDQVIAEQGKVTKISSIVPFEKVDAVKTELESFGKDVTIEAIISFAKEGKAQLDKKRATCLKAYKNAVGEPNEDQAVIATIQSADNKLLDGLLKQYGKKLGEQFTGTCNDCKSTNVTFRTTEPEADPEGKKGEADFNMPESFRR